MIAALKDTATIFMSTHILADVERVCDQVGIIDHGRLITAGKRSELLARYHTDVILIELEPGHEKILATWLKDLKDGLVVTIDDRGRHRPYPGKGYRIGTQGVTGIISQVEAARPEVRGFNTRA